MLSPTPGTTMQELDAHEKRLQGRQEELRAIEHRVAQAQQRVEADAERLKKAMAAVEVERGELKARASELAAHEESLEAWKSQFKAEAVRQIAERERLLTEWQARLDRRQADVEEQLRAAEVGGQVGGSRLLSSLCCGAAVGEGAGVGVPAGYWSVCLCSMVGLLASA